jgi:hypothetical protein
MSISPEVSLDQKVEEDKEEAINTKRSISSNGSKSRGNGILPKGRPSQIINAAGEEDDRFFDLDKLKSIPSYSSVLNNPKRSNFLQNLMPDPINPIEVKQQSSIADFESYINKMQKLYNKYMRYHRKAEDMAPNMFSRKKDAISAVNKIPDDLFNEDFKLTPEFFTLKSIKEASARNELMSEYLEVVENFLIANVAENFDFFSQSFDNIRDMEHEMGEIKIMIQDIKHINSEKKKQIVSNMVGVYFLNRRMTIMKQIREHLVLIKILRESIPVIRNLIKNGSSFNTVMELTEKSFRLINERLSPLKVAMQLKEKIQNAEVKSKKRIEEEFKALLEANFNSNIQFNSCLEDEACQKQLREF